MYRLPAIAAILFYWITTKVVQQLTGLTLGRPNGPVYWTGELLNTPLVVGGGPNFPRTNPLRHDPFFATVRGSVRVRTTPPRGRIWLEVRVGTNFKKKFAGCVLWQRKGDYDLGGILSGEVDFLLKLYLVYGTCVVSKKTCWRDILQSLGRFRSSGQCLSRREDGSSGPSSYQRIEDSEFKRRRLRRSPELALHCRSARRLRHSRQHEPIRPQSDHLLDTKTFHRTTQQVHDQLLLDQEHLLPAVERAAAATTRPQTDDSVLPVDSIHTTRSGYLLLHSDYLLARTQQQGKTIVQE